MQHKIQNINVAAHDWNQLRSSFTRLYHAPRGIKYFEVQTLFWSAIVEVGFAPRNIWSLSAHDRAG